MKTLQYTTMKKYLLILSVLVLGFASCSKDSTPPAPPYDAAAQLKIDDAAIKAYLTTHPEITATKDTTGLYYQVLAAGTGEQITNASTVTVSYKGTDLKNMQFDAADNYTTAIAASSNVIAGWKIGLPKIKNGGKILLIIPSGYAYGPYANGPIPANSVLVFTITVKAVNGVVAPPTT
jgi:FKBP-type peptidyl-prolyl cis-trans isomerase FkpA